MRTLPRLGAGLAALGLVLAVGACSSDDSGGDGVPSTTTAASSGSTTGTAASSGTAGEASKSIDDLSNTDINEYLEANYPDEWALVDWDIITWSAFGGYTVTIESGSTADQALAVCEAVGEIVYDYTDEQDIEIVVDDVAVVTATTTGSCAAA